jgi:competence protein ComGC
MKEAIKAFRARLFKNKGETLIETLISLFLLTILFGAVANVIILSLRITQNSISRGKEIQEQFVNDTTRVVYAVPGNEDIITFSGSIIDASHDIYFFNDNIIAFTPNP